MIIFVWNHFSNQNVLIHLFYEKIVHQYNNYNVYINTGQINLDQDSMSHVFPVSLPLLGYGTVSETYFLNMQRRSQVFFFGMDMTLKCKVSYGSYSLHQKNIYLMVMSHLLTRYGTFISTKL